MNNIKLVFTKKINNKKELQEYHQKFLSEGYEGSIIRWGNEGYKPNGRSSNLLKYKDFSDIAIIIHDVVPSEVVPEHGQFIFYWKGAKGHSYGDDYSILQNKLLQIPWKSLNDLSLKIKDSGY